MELGPIVIRAGVFSRAGQLLGKTKLSTKPERGPEAVLARVERCVAYAVDECDLALSRVGAVGVALPAQVSDGIVRLSSALGWREVPVQRVLEERLSLPVAIGNVHNLAAFAVATQEFPNSPRPMVVVFPAAEIGGAVLSAEGWVALEAVAECGLMVQNPAENILRSLPPSQFSAFRSRDYRRAVRAGSTAARAFLLQAADVAAHVAGALCAQFGAKTLVLAGGAIDEMREEILARVQAQLPASSAGSVLVSRLGDVAVLAGAALQASVVSPASRKLR